MRHKISFKAIIIGAVADVGGSNIWGILLIIYLSSKYQTSLLPHAQQVAQLQNLIHDPLITIVNTVIGSAFSILGGYIAARIAKHNELLNGTLSSFLCEIFSFVAIGSSPFYVVILGIIGNPLLGFIGGYVQLLQKKRNKR